MPAEIRPAEMNGPTAMPSLNVPPRVASDLARYRVGTNVVMNAWRASENTAVPSPVTKMQMASCHHCVEKYAKPRAASAKRPA